MDCFSTLSLGGVAVAKWARHKTTNLGEAGWIPCFSGLLDGILNQGSGALDKREYLVIIGIIFVNSALKHML